MGQAPIASTESFRIVFEGLVGRNTLGNIAIDDISISPGVCPTAPQVDIGIGWKMFPYKSILHNSKLIFRLLLLVQETVLLRMMSAGKVSQWLSILTF